MADMHIMYDLAHYNRTETCRLGAEQSTSIKWKDLYKDWWSTGGLIQPATDPEKIQEWAELQELRLRRKVL